MQLSPGYTTTVVAPSTCSVLFGSMVMLPVPSLRNQKWKPSPAVAAASSESDHVPVALNTRPQSVITTEYAADFDVTSDSASVPRMIHPEFAALRCFSRPLVVSAHSM